MVRDGFRNVSRGFCVSGLADVSSGAARTRMTITATMITPAAGCGAASPAAAGAGRAALPPGRGGRQAGYLDSHDKFLRA